MFGALWYKKFIPGFGARQSAADSHLWTAGENLPELISAPMILQTQNLPRFNRNNFNCANRVFDILFKLAPRPSFGVFFYYPHVLLIMIIDVNNFNDITAAINKNSPIDAGNAETVNTQMFWFQNFRMQTGMERIALKHIQLLVKPGCQIAFLQKGRQSRFER